MMKEEVKKDRMDVMIDLETTSLAENAGILSIAAVPFYRESGTTAPLDKVFFEIVDLNSCFMAGMELSGSQQWWIGKEPALKLRFVNCEKEPISTAILQFHNYLSTLNEKYDLHLWSRGTDFDFPKLEWCFRHILEVEIPYPYYNKRDVRTFVKEMEVNEDDFEFEGTKHWALDDANHQIKLVKAAFNRITF